jgi:predicted kinase
MGNQSSKTSDSEDGANLKTLPQAIDYIATNYILTQNFSDMEKLSRPQYCDELVVLTSKVISQKLNDMEVRYLAQRLQEGVVIDKMTNGKVIYLKKKELPRLDVQSKTTKRRLCVGIAKFYVQVAHLFAAIVTTVNPAYTFVGEDGVKQTVGLLKKKRIPEGANAQLTKVGLCSSRINALLNGQDYTKQDGSDIVVNPKFCKLNSTGSGGGSEVKTLGDEPGIPELKRLYYDQYDYDQSGDKRVVNNGFNAMSPAMQKVYDEDVKRFYLEFSGEETVPEHIKEFGQIKLRDFRRSRGCAKDGVYTKGYTGSLKQQLFKQYADHTQQMIERANASQDKLLDVLDELFKFSYDQVEKKKHVIINPALNEKTLQELINKTRKLIVELYLTCEQDFVSGLKIYEAIVEKQVVDTSIAQLKSMNESLDIMGTAEPIAVAKPSSGDAKQASQQPAPENQEPVITKPLAEKNKEQAKPMAELNEKAKETTQAVLQETKDATKAIGDKIGNLEGKLKNVL